MPTERLASAENHVRVDHFAHQRHLDANREGGQPLRALQIALHGEHDVIGKISISTRVEHLCDSDFGDAVW